VIKWAVGDRKKLMSKENKFKTGTALGDKKPKCYDN